MEQQRPAKRVRFAEEACVVLIEELEDAAGGAEHEPGGGAGAAGKQATRG